MKTRFIRTMKQLWTAALCLSGLMTMITSCASENETDDEKTMVEYFAFQAEKDGKFGLIGVDGQVLIAPKWEEAPKNGAQGRFFAKDDSLFCLYTTEKNPQRIGNDQYKDAGVFCNGLCPVVKPGMWPQYIDRDGNVVIDCREYDGVNVKRAYSFNEGLAEVDLANGKVGFINTKGELVIPAKYGDANRFSNGYCVVRYDKFSLETISDEYTWYVIDKEGNELYAAKSESMSYVGYYQENGLMMAFQGKGDDSKSVIVNTKGEKVLTPDCDKAEELIGDLFVFERNGMYGIMNVKGEVVVPAKYESLKLAGDRIIETKIGDDDMENYKSIVMNFKGEVYNTLDSVFSLLPLESGCKNDTHNMLCLEKMDQWFMTDSIGKKISSTPIVSLDFDDNAFVSTDFVDIGKMLDDILIDSKGMMRIKLGDGPKILEKLKAEAEKLDDPIVEIEGNEAVYKIMLGDEECGVKLIFDKPTDREDAKLKLMAVIILNTGKVEDLEALVKERLEKVATYKEDKEEVHVYEVNNESYVYYIGQNDEVYAIIISSEAVI